MVSIFAFYRKCWFVSGGLVGDGFVHSVRWLWPNHCRAGQEERPGDQDEFISGDDGDDGDDQDEDDQGDQIEVDGDDDDDDAHFEMLAE